MGSFFVFFFAVVGGEGGFKFKDKYGKQNILGK